MLDGVGKARTAKDGGQPVEPQLVPQDIEHPDITEGQGRFKAQLRGIAFTSRESLGAQQASEQRIKRAAALVDTPEGGYCALTWLAVLIGKGLHQLRSGDRQRR